MKHPEKWFKLITIKLPSIPLTIAVRKTVRRNININYKKHKKQNKRPAQRPADVLNQSLSVDAVYALGLVRRCTSNAVSIVNIFSKWLPRAKEARVPRRQRKVIRVITAVDSCLEADLYRMACTWLDRNLSKNGQVKEEQAARMEQCMIYVMCWILPWQRRQ